MDIMLISYADYNFDGRLRALAHVFSQLGNLKCFVKNGPNENNIVTCNTNYALFIRESVRYARKIKHIDLLVLDNRKATIPGLLIRKLLRPKCIIQDCRELYRIKEVQHFAGKIGCIFEKAMVNRANIIIAANNERATIMQKENHLKRKPLTYENLRVLVYESEEKLEKAKERLDQFINDDEIKIISSSGCNVKRTTDILVRNLPKVRKKCRLFLVGESEQSDIDAIRKLAEKDDINHVTILGRLNQTELKYLISRCDIGIVNYGQYDSNNKYCASGKLYEFIYEGIPVVTTTNPPLKKLCEEENIGIADDEYYKGITELVERMDYYKLRVSLFAKKNTVENNDAALVKELKRLLPADTSAGTRQ